ncbi:histidinol-phosphatase HisJ family protein [Gracilibacillus alcaliphilus]|uniref:histidinol-phosphatase HisJ family protein n=1 Tax=Gracilibacillus alcaliphilus TaxID=1401441 RepID=UPI0019561EC5|nr:histidinol-phosphatase HisJ family protein [Gracilibacillus alcaliphilus]MBM7676737.1 histidinol-phosphatase (PHP family) [Gracilibacillus alcaliphilus]
MKFDLHNHHYRCGHAEGNIEDYIKAAIERGLSYIGIADHSPYFYSEEDQLYPGIAMAKSEFPNYVKEVLDLKKKYQGKIHVLLGMESDYFPSYEELYQKMYSPYPFDYIIGSVHYVEGINIFARGRWNGLNEEERIAEKELYYKLIQQSARSGLFQILGHIDAMKGFYPKFSQIETPIIEETLQVIAQEGVAIEVNTSGKMKDCGGWYPSHEILERACYYGVDISFGSDAHVPERIGDEYEEVQQTLREIGFKEMVYYVEKKRRAVSL